MEFELNYKTKFENVPIGSRVDVTVGAGTITGFLESIDLDGVWVNWQILEWSRINGKNGEGIREKHQFIPFENIKTFSWMD